MKKTRGQTAKLAVGVVFVALLLGGCSTLSAVIFGAPVEGCGYYAYVIRQDYVNGEWRPLRIETPVSIEARKADSCEFTEPIEGWQALLTQVQTEFPSYFEGADGATFGLRERDWYYSENSLGEVTQRYANVLVFFTDIENQEPVR